MAAPEVVEHRAGDPALEHPLLQREAVDQERGHQGLEVPDADRVPGAGADLGDVEPSFSHCRDSVLVVGDLPLLSPAGEFDLDRSV